MQRDGSTASALPADIEVFSEEEPAMTTANNADLGGCLAETDRRP